MAWGAACRTDTNWFVLYCTVLYCTALRYIILHYTLLYCTALYCIILYRADSRYILKHRYRSFNHLLTPSVVIVQSITLPSSPHTRPFSILISSPISSSHLSLLPLLFSLPHFFLPPVTFPSFPPVSPLPFCRMCTDPLL